MPNLFNIAKVIGRKTK